MRREMLSLSLVIMAIWSAAALADNLVRNPSFEELDDKGKPQSWQTESPAIAVDAAEKRSGKQAIRIEHREGGQNFSQACQQIPLKKNTLYKASCYAKIAPGLESQKDGAPRLYITGVGGKQDTFVCIPITSLEWKKVESSFNSGDYDAVNLRVYLHNSKGTVWYDDVELKEVTPATNRSWVFDTDGDELDWSLSGGGAVVVRNGALSAVIAPQDGPQKPCLYSPMLAVSAAEIKALRLNMRVGASGTVWIMYKPKGGAWVMGSCVMGIIGDTAYRTYVVKLWEDPVWKGEFEQLRFLFPAQEGAWLDLRSVELLPAPVANLIVNGSFEDFRPGTLVTPWRVMPNGIAAATTTDKASDGLQSLRINGKGAIELSTTADFDFLEAEDSWTLSFDHLAEAVAGKASLAATVTAVDALGHELGTRSIVIPLAAGDRFVTTGQSLALPPLTKRAIIRLRADFPEQSSALLDNVSLSKSQRPASDTVGKKDEWWGEWIRPGGVDHVTGRMFFRKQFTLNDEARTASLVMTADDSAIDIHVNGKPLTLKENAKKTLETDRYEIADLLVKGENLIAFETYNGATQGGLLCELGIILRNGSYKLVKSDPSFKSTTTPTEGWHKPGFDDSSWQEPSFSYGAPPVAPWGKRVKYQFIGICDKVTVNAVVFPKEVTPGRPARLELKFIPSVKDLKLVLRLEVANSRFELFNGKLADLKPNQENSWSKEITLSEFLPEGDARLIATFEKATVTGTGVESGSVVARFTRPKPTANSSVPVKAVIQVKNGQIPLLSLNGEPWELTHEWTGSFDGGPDRFITEEKLGNCRDNGIHLYWIDMRSVGGEKASQGQYDFAAVDDHVLRLLQIDPAAQILLEFPVDMHIGKDFNAWKDANPDELFKDEKGEALIPLYSWESKSKEVSWASTKWLDLQKTTVRELVRHVQSKPWASRIIGYGPHAGLGVEWVYWGGHSAVFPGDYSAPFVNGFREYCKTQYKTIEALNAAWHTTLTAFDAVTLPTGAERDTADFHTFVDPAKSRKPVDFKEYFSTVVATAILELGKVVKEDSKGNALYGVYYGYITTLQIGRGDSGHYAIESLLNSPYVDFLTAIIRYDNRRPGEECGTISPYESTFLLHDKVLMAQSDLRTVRSDESASLNYRAPDIHTSISTIERDFARNLIDGTGFEIGYGGYGWIEMDKRMMQVVGRCRTIEKAMQDIPRKTMDRDTSVAVIVDGACSSYTITKSDVHRVTMVDQIPFMYHAGVGIDCYLLSDLEKMPDYKCYFFLNTFRITDAQKAFIDKKLKTAGKTLVWVYAPGLIGDDKLDPARIAELTGIRMAVKDRELKPVTTITLDNGLLKMPGAKGKTFTYLSPAKIGPQFVPEEGAVLGSINDGGDPGLVVKKNPDWTSIYSFGPALPPFLVRAIADYAGVHVANRDENDTTYASDRLLAIHTKTPGKRTIHLPPKWRNAAKELFTDRAYPVKDGVMELEVEPLTTYLFLFE